MELSTNSIGTTGLKSFFEWWRGNLAKWVPAKIRNAYGSPPLLASIVFVEDHFQVRVKRTGILGFSHHAQHYDCQNLQEVQHQISALKPWWKPMMSVELVLPVRRCLELERDIPARAEGQAHSVLQLELQRIVPFPAESVFMDYYIFKGAGVGSMLKAKLLVAKRTLVEPILAQLKAGNYVLHGIGVEDDQGVRLPVELLPGDVRKQFALGISGWLRRLIVTLMVCFVLVGTLAAAMQIWQLSSLHQKLDTKVGQSMKQAKAITKALNFQDAQIATSEVLRNRKASSPMVVEIIEEISKILPLSAYVQKIRLSENEVRLTGYAASASSLVRLISSSEMFESASFFSPVTLDPGSKKERFELQIKLAVK